MHIHAYQIYNVLDVYRKQLSQGTESARKSPATAPMNPDKVSLMAKGQRQSIIDKVSTEIVERIARFDPQSTFDETLARYLQEPLESGSGDRPVKDSEFTYTLIDEHNQRITNTLTIRNFRPLESDSDQSMQESGVGTQLPDFAQNGRSGEIDAE